MAENGKSYLEMFEEIERSQAEIRALKNEESGLEMRMHAMLELADSLGASAVVTEQSLSIYERMFAQIRRCVEALKDRIHYLESCLRDLDE